MKVVKITSSFFGVGKDGVSRPLFEGGKHYPLDEASQRQVDIGNGAVVDAPDDPEKAESAAEKAEAQAEAAAGRATLARDAADAAAVAAAVLTAQSEQAGQAAG